MLGSEKNELRVNDAMTTVLRFRVPTIIALGKKNTSTIEMSDDCALHQAKTSQTRQDDRDEEINKSHIRCADGTKADAKATQRPAFLIRH